MVLGPRNKEDEMKKFMMLLPVLLTTSTASADTVVLRSKSNEYALVGEGTAVTKDCTVTAEGKLDGKVVRKGKKSWLLFIDRDGEEEAQCEVRYTIGFPRPVSRTMVAVRK